jgi:uncharacterized protein (DUF1800 family)
LEPFRTLRMNTREIVENFPPPQVIKAVAEGKAGLPRDPTRRAVYEAQLDKFEDKKARKQQAAPASPDVPAAGDASAESKPPKMSEDELAARREARLYADLKAQEILDMPPDERMKQVLAMSPDEQRALASMKGEQRNDLMEGMSPQQKETIMALNNPTQVVVNELMQAKLLRAVYSERQLEEVMTDFWFNHFNVFINKGADRYLITSYERDTIRPHALGKFEDLLVATAKSPAMLFYLDNWLSVGPDSQLAMGAPRHPRRSGYGRRRFTNDFPRQRQPKAKNRERRGLNENYGRELMELHTLGVNGGYTQNDVTELARVLTGWTIEQPRKGGGFRFEERMHEPGTKLVLGHKIKEGGEGEGKQVLHILAHHPSTARFISTKLAMRFVSDDPPTSLIDRMTATFLKKDGDIREVLRTLFRSPEFWAPAAYRAKVKSPLEFIVSAVRATGADIQDATPLVRTLNTLGMMPYGMQPPTGYSMKADTWVNSSALLGRMNFALALTNGKMKGVTVDPGRWIDSQTSDPQDAVVELENNLLPGNISRQTHDTIMQQLNNPQISPGKLADTSRPPNVGAIAGLILGSPEFQRR